MSKRHRAPARVNPAVRHQQEQWLGLDGAWQFRLDPGDRGKGANWHQRPEALSEEISVPGCWQGQGFGREEPEIVRDFRLRARTLRATYKGTGWYARSFRVPEHWEGRRLWLNFGGVHPSAEVWVNGQPVGGNSLPFVPFGLEITGIARPGQDNQVVVRVYEHHRALGMAYNWQGNWSGLYRSVELAVTGETFLERLRLWPSVREGRIRIFARIADTERAGGPLTLRGTVQAVEGSEAIATAEAPVEQGTVFLDLPVPDPRLWSPETPNLYRVDVALLRGEETLDARAERVGFVELSTCGKHFLINGQPYYLRGTGDFLAHPETASPDTDRERWRRKLRVLREYGYNYVRCQSYVPAPEYFDVADEVGLLVQSEMGVLGAWGGHSIWHVYPWPQPTPDHRQILQRQWDLVVERDVNHPSANLYCMSNEWPADMPFPRTAWDCYRRTKAIKPTAFVIWTDGTYRADLPGDFVNAEAQVDEQCDKPVIQHEFRWWSAFPDVRIMSKYTGAVRPYGAEIALAAARRYGLEHILPQAAENSQRLQFIEAKGKMEACRRDHPRLAGICHFTAMDSNPSPQGIIDEFYEEKVTPPEVWRQTNGDTVVLSSLGFDDRVLAVGERRRISLFVSDFSHPPLQAPRLRWALLAGERVLDEGEVAYSHRPFFTCPAGEIEITGPPVPAPVAARLRASLSEGERLSTNEWSLWVFPDAPAFPPDVAVYGKPRHTWLRTLQGMPLADDADLVPGRFPLVLTERLTPPLLDFAREGGRVLLAASEGLVRPFQPKLGMRDQYFFTPPANYPTYEDGQNGTIISDHPLFGDFPHEGFADLQFYRLISGQPPLDLEPLGLAAGTPILRVIHSYPVGRPLAYLVERRWGKGGLILSALNLDQAWPEARWLAAEIFRYAAGAAFAPDLDSEEKTLKRLLAATALP